MNFVIHVQILKYSHYNRPKLGLFEKHFRKCLVLNDEFCIYM